MKLTISVFLGALLQVAVTNPIHGIKNGGHQKIKTFPGEKFLAYNDQQDPQLWEKSEKFEGDIALTQEQKKHLFSENEEKNGAIHTAWRWPNKTIPYVISDDFTADEKSFIERTLEEDFGRSCVQVVPRTNQVDYIFVTGNDTGCWSYIGRAGGKQVLHLSPNGCLVYATVVHEFLHAAGFFHMQSATERDDFVTILWENIHPGSESNFMKYGPDQITNFGETYDYGSVLHYPVDAFSKNGEKTIIPKENVEIGKAPKLSSVDIVKLNRMYNC